MFYRSAKTNIGKKEAKFEKSPVPLKILFVSAHLDFSARN